ncbi:putative mariner transposase [Trichonephila clavipes]|nr:putative mariner transposase [Trichonephila clavipes]
MDRVHVEKMSKSVKSFFLLHAKLLLAQQKKLPTSPHRLFVPITSLTKEEQMETIKNFVVIVILLEFVNREREREGGTLNSRRAASPLVRLVEGEERIERPKISQEDFINGRTWIEPSQPEQKKTLGFDDKLPICTTEVEEIVELSTPMNSDSDVEIENETPFITVIFSNVSLCLETVKAYIMHQDAWLDKRYSDFAPGKSTVEKWFAKFKRDKMSPEDDARSGRPKEAVTDENIKKVCKIIFDNRTVKLIKIPESLKISKERVGHIVNEYLDKRKLCSKWVPRELTID